MNLGAVIVLLKLFEESGITKVSPDLLSRPFEKPRGPVTPPTSKAGARPDCGPGKKAILQFDSWVCVPDFD